MSTILTGIGAAIASVVPFVAFKRQSGDVAHIEPGNVPDPFLELPREPVTDADWENEVSILELERASRKRQDVPCETSSETEAVEVDVKLVKLQPETRSKRDESIKWIKEFHRVSGELPTWTETRTTLKLSAASASRYRAQAALELGIQPEKKAA